MRDSQPKMSSLRRVLDGFHLIRPLEQGMNAIAVEELAGFEIPFVGETPGSLESAQQGVDGSQFVHHPRDRKAE
ncbi:MAG: hypothetical protein FIA97_17055 [Methylococcaceae bacterium]|nr:hypothetical protein [Methylococcaceae bacterium]